MKDRKLEADRDFLYSRIWELRVKCCLEVLRLWRWWVGAVLVAMCFGLGLGGGGRLEEEKVLDGRMAKMGGAGRRMWWRG